MGWKVSMLIIQNPENFSDEALLFEKLGLTNYKYSSDTVLDECICPFDKSINIGFYNGSIIICDGFSLIDSFINDLTTYKERELIKLFPQSELLTVACISTTNAHGYSLIKTGIKTRVKMIDADNGFMYNLGEQFEEEQKIYARSKLVNGQHVWEFDFLPGDEFKEDQMMEEFTFEVAKRLLGVRIDLDEGDKLLFEVPFKKYLPNLEMEQHELNSMSGKWIGEFEYGPLYGDELYGQKASFELTIEENKQGEFSGTCIDLDGIGAHDSIADIKGFRDNNFISFVKEYPKHLNFDLDNNLVENQNMLQSSLSYKGTYNPFTGKFTGEWEIHSIWKTDNGGTQEDIVYGTWDMKREK